MMPIWNIGLSLVEKTSVIFKKLSRYQCCAVVHLYSSTNEKIMSNEHWNTEKRENDVLLQKFQGMKVIS